MLLVHFSDLHLGHRAYDRAEKGKNVRERDVAEAFQRAVREVIKLKPGLILLVPFVQQIVRIDQRTLVLDVPSQDVISRDNVSVKVNAVVYFRVVAPMRAVLEVEDYYYATSQLCQTTLRSIVGQIELDELLAERDKRLTLRVR